MEHRTFPEFSTNYPLLLATFMKRPVRYYPDQIGVVYRNHVSGDYQRLTWRVWYQRVCQLGHALQGRLKIKPGQPGRLGDRVGTMAYNTHRHLELYYAVPCIGATLHPINIRLSEEHIVYTINHAQDTVIFVDDMVLPLLENIYERIKDTVQVFVYMSDKPGLPQTRLPNLIEYEELIAAESGQFDWPYLDEDTTATLCYTTGTTGQPKGATFTHRQLYLMTLHSMARQSIVNTPGFVAVERLGENAVPMLNTPLFHIHGWGAPFTTVFSAQKIVLPGTFTVRGFCELVEREKVTSVGIVPTIAALLLEFADFDKYDLSSLVNVGVGGGALPLGLKTKLEKALPHFRAGSGYGMTETAPVSIGAFVKKHMVQWPKEAIDEVMVKTGLPSLGLEVEVVDGQGVPVPWNNQTVGEIVIRGPWVTQEYYKAPERTAEVWHDGWFHTGDLAKVDKEGFVVIADRLKDVIRSGAEMVPTVLLENLIALADFVLEAAVVGVPDPVWGEVPMAVVSLRPGSAATEEDVVDFLAEHGVQTGRITKWMLPRLVALTREIPKTSVGKYDKKAIRENLPQFLAIAKNMSRQPAWPAPT
ncbi:long-chain-fatty-acid--CoA ligase [Verminephrobacter eiseniae]|uniref:long-chain-fatty-acid--CoA ligase n=1 Tax=Verminephrobacter eiseniae TaxID=364317 RepID=UPI0022375A2E|nr:long-chain-fatty-acid--CoA ligase [Verminephrobacter eiseniae]MCW5239007.1 fatty-acid--CoA ligase [Verminephrobacter eiseniae]